MKYLIASLLILLLVVVIVVFIRKEQNRKYETRIEKSFNSGWLFNNENEKSDKWIEIEIPHTPRIEPLIVNDQWQGTMWDKKNLG